MTWPSKTPRLRPLKRWLKKSWGNGLIMGALILLVAILIAWGNVLGR